MSFASSYVRLLHPLSLFYKPNGEPLPLLNPVDGSDVPQPYRNLLVHDSDMTSTLEDYFEGEMIVKPLHITHQGDAYSRSVLLTRKSDGLIAEFGAIQIHLEALPRAASERVIEASRPLGGILAEHDIDYISRPSAYFRLTPDARICEVMHIDADGPLYGRQNTITASSGPTIAQVLEVLPPIHKTEQAGVETKAGQDSSS